MQMTWDQIERKWSEMTRRAQPVLPPMPGSGAAEGAERGRNVHDKADETRAMPNSTMMAG